MVEKMKAPSVDGTPEKLQGYKEDALQHLMAVEMRKRYLVGPRLVQELTGTAIRCSRARRPCKILSSSHM